MPYIAIKAYPKDEETKKKLVDRINDVLLETWGCPQEAVSISIEEVEPSEWNRAVMEKEVLPFEDRMMILEGKKRY
ncbi:MAG: tautomerase family protein [Spirochaetales bacterium]|nr:tautomerase family protein [Spirochaetales bacterium]